VATNAEELQQQGAEHEEEAKQAAEGEEQQPESNGEDSPYADLAKDLGWTPKDKYTGPPEQWKDAETFIRDGRDIQRDTSRELKDVKARLDTIASTSASIVEQQVKERVDDLTVKFKQAVEDGDDAAAFKISEQIRTTAAAATPQGPSPEARAFAERNAGWFQKPGHEDATFRAIEICNTLAAQGYKDHGTQLQIAEQRLRREMPELFANQKNGKPAPGVNAPGSRAPAPSNRAKGYADLPPEARKVADDMADRDVFKLGDVTKSRDLYARNYFANTERKQ
jgi:hypothetical protein